MRALAFLGATLFLCACQPDAQTNNPAVATDGSVAERAAQAPAEGATSFTEEQARDHLSKNGYTDMSGLSKTPEGMWQGSATKDGKPVTVTVDYQGNITPQS